MSKIQTIEQLRDEIRRVKQESDFCKLEIRNSYNNFKRSLTPLNLIITILGELKQDAVFKSAVDVFNRVREYFKKK